MRKQKYRVWCSLEDQMGPEMTLTELIANGPFLHDAEIDIPLQYTGLKDKNGRDIHEGDIIEWLDRTGEVYFKNGEFSVKWGKGGDAFNERLSVHSTHQVIGNIYENPELLK